MITQLLVGSSHLIFLFISINWKNVSVHGSLWAVFKWRHCTGTDLFCVITSLSVWGKISCNITLKYILDVWEMFSESHNSILLQAQIQPLKIKLSTVQKGRAGCEWEVMLIFVCLSLSSSSTMLPYLWVNRASSISPSGNFLCIDWRVLLKLWQKGQLSHIHLQGLDDTRLVKQGPVVRRLKYILQCQLQPLSVSILNQIYKYLKS